jgi:hypothetical protein
MEWKDPSIWQSTKRYWTNFWLGESRKTYSPRAA